MPGAARPPTTEDSGTTSIRVVAGLGNPEPRYSGTRHNAGQMVVDLLATRLGVARFTAKYGGRFAEARGPSGPVALLIPQTFMNASGDAVGPAAGALHASPERVLVVHDELDLPFGTVRGKMGGGHGGHNGLRSVSAGLGGGDYARVRLGIGRPPPEFRGDPADWVLTRFVESRADVQDMVARAADMVEVALADGMPAAIERFHASEPGAKARRRHERRVAEAAPGADEPDE